MVADVIVVAGLVPETVHQVGRSVAAVASTVEARPPATGPSTAMALRVRKRSSTSADCCASPSIGNLSHTPDRFASRGCVRDFGVRPINDAFLCHPSYSLLEVPVLLRWPFRCAWRERLLRI